MQEGRCALGDNRLQELVRILPQLLSEAKSAVFVHRPDPK
jgi:hypothetical protein